MASYIMRRLITAIPALFVVATIVFVLMRLIPGDPAAVMLGHEADPTDIARLRQSLGLEAPLYVQLARWYARILQGDFGESLFLRMPVTSALLGRLEPTILLTILASAFAIGLGVPLGAVSAARAGTWIDQFCMVTALLGVSVPSFWLGLGLILVFAVALGWLPSGGYVAPYESLVGTARYLLLPAISLGFMQSAWIARTVRAAVLDTLTEDYVRTAQAKGLTNRAVMLRHVLRNAMLPVVTVVGLSFAIMLGGSIVIETVFNIPGIGRLIISSVMRRDYPIIQGGVFFVAATYVLVNLCVDLSYGFFDPRIAYR